MFGPRRQAECRGVIKNLILVGAIIMLVALVRHVFRYLSSSPVTTGNYAYDKFDRCHVPM